MRSNTGMRLEEESSGLKNARDETIVCSPTKSSKSTLPKFRSAAGKIGRKPFSREEPLVHVAEKLPEFNAESGCNVRGGMRTR